MEGDAGRKLREASRVEQFFNSQSRLYLDSYVTFAARFVNTAGDPLSRPLLFTALEKVIHEHAALSARLPHPSVSSSWVQLPVVDLNKIVMFVDKGFDDLETVYKDVFDGPIDHADDTPMWRLLVLRDGTIVFAYDHTLGDGQSGYAFYHALLAALETSQATIAEHSGLVKPSQDAELPPALEDAMDVSTPFRVLVREISKGFFPSLSGKTTAWTGNPIVKVPTMATTVRVSNYSPPKTSRLIHLARAHKTTLTGVLHTLALFVLSPLVRARHGDKYKSVSTNIPTSLRAYARTPPTAICNHISGYPRLHPLLPPARTRTRLSVDTFPWDVAASLTDTLRREAPLSAGTVGMLKLLGGKYETYQLGLLGGRREQGFQVSNVGALPPRPVLPAQGEPQWRIEETSVALANATIGPAIKLTVCGTGAGGLGTTITWGKGAVDHALAEDFVSGFREGMDVLTGLGGAAKL